MADLEKGQGRLPSQSDLSGSYAPEEKQTTQHNASPHIGHSRASSLRRGSRRPSSDIGLDLDLIRRRQELEEMDTDIRMNWQAIRAIITAGVGFFTDAYDMFVINIVSLILGYVYYHDAPGDDKNRVPVKWDTLIKAATQIGALIGQLGFGYLGDRFGRTGVFAMGLILVIFCTIASAFSNSMVKGFNVFIVLFIWRLLLGCGVGGDYPLAATITSEYASVKRRGQLMAMVFSSQCLGNIAAPIVALVLMAIFKHGIENDVENLDYVWRMALGLAAVPGVCTLYFRLTMPESKRYEMEKAKTRAIQEGERELLLKKQTNGINDRNHVSSSSSSAYPEKPGDLGNNSSDRQQSIHGVTEVSRDPSTIATEVPSDNSHNTIGASGLSVGQDTTTPPTRGAQVVMINQPKTFRQYFSQWRNLKILLGTSISWFALDVAFYGINLNSSIVINAIGFSGSLINDPPYHVLTRNALGSLIINLLGSLPGYLLSILLVEKLGRKRIQLIGFAMLTILYIVLGFAYHQILDRSVAGFIVLFSAAQLFQNFGPNVTTFIIPGEVFPTRFRSTAHGISAAAGKLGAIVSQVGFFQLKDRGGKDAFINHLLQIFSLFMLIGFLVTLWIPETKGKSLEEISNEGEDEAL